MWEPRCASNILSRGLPHPYMGDHGGAETSAPASGYVDWPQTKNNTRKAYLFSTKELTGSKV